MQNESKVLTWGAGPLDSARTLPHKSVKAGKSSSYNRRSLLDEVKRLKETETHPVAYNRALKTHDLDDWEPSSAERKSSSVTQSIIVLCNTIIDVKIFQSLTAIHGAMLLEWLWKIKSCKRGKINSCKRGGDNSKRNVIRYSTLLELSWMTFRTSSEILKGIQSKMSDATLNSKDSALWRAVICVGGVWTKYILQTQGFCFVLLKKHCCTKAGTHCCVYGAKQN